MFLRTFCISAVIVVLEWHELLIVLVPVRALANVCTLSVVLHCLCSIACARLQRCHCCIGGTGCVCMHRGCRLQYT